MWLRDVMLVLPVGAPSVTASVRGMPFVRNVGSLKHLLNEKEYLRLAARQRPGSNLTSGTGWHCCVWGWVF